MSQLKSEKLVFAYDQSFQMSDVDLDFSHAKIHVLLGLNGSGKTTLIKLLAGLLKPNSGAVYLDDKNLSEYSHLERSKHISYVAQNINLGDDHFVLDFLSFGSFNTLKWFESPKKETIEKIEEKAKQLKIEHLLKKRMNALSGGQRQMVLICKALVQETNIIIFDEPTSSLDFKNQKIVLETIKNIALDENKIIILSSHNPNNALYLQSDVVLIDQGKVLKHGPAEEIIIIENLKPIFGDDLTYSNDLNYHEISFKNE